MRGAAHSAGDQLSFQVGVCARIFAGLIRFIVLGSSRRNSNLDASCDTVNAVAGSFALNVAQFLELR